MEQLLNHRAAGVVKVWWVEKENQLNPPNGSGGGKAAAPIRSHTFSSAKLDFPQFRLVDRHVVL